MSESNSSFHVSLTEERDSAATGIERLRKVQIEDSSRQKEFFIQCQAQVAILLDPQGRVYQFHQIVFRHEQSSSPARFL